MQTSRRSIRQRHLFFEALEQRKVFAGFLYVGSDAGPVSTVKVFGDPNRDGKYEETVQVFQPFGGFTGGARVATGNFDGDANTELVVAAGPNGKTQVKIYDINGDGSIGSLIDSFFAFGQASKVGVQVATGDVNSDGLSELFVSTDKGGGRVREYRDTDGDTLYSDNLVDQLFPFGTTFKGGVALAAGNTNNSGGVELIVGQASGGSQVKVLSDTDADIDLSDETPLETFNGFAASYKGGVNLAAGVLDGAGNGGAEVFVSGATNSKSVRIFTDSNSNGTVSDNPIAEVVNAYPTNVPGGVRIAAGDTDSSGVFVELVTVPGSGVAPKLQIFDDSADAGSKIGDDPPVDTFNAYPVKQTTGSFVAFGKTLEESDGYTGFPQTIPDQSNLNTSVFVPKGAGIIRDLDVTLNIFHSFDGDLDITLTHVTTGTSVILFQDVGSTNEGFFVRLNDEAGSDISGASNPKTDGAINGMFNPGGLALLSDFDGEDASGEWRLSIVDDSAGDMGTLFGWSLIIAYA